MEHYPPGLEQALTEWAFVLGNDRVLSKTKAHQQYGANTIAVNRVILAALRPTSQEHIPALINTARKYSIPLYPISTGNNWGYGSALPIIDGCVIVDLSDMNRVIDMDPETGLVTLEPGVTQQSLRAFLENNNLPFLVPVTGAGPNCSIVGNALERGYGITPYADHFSAVMSLQAVLPNGDRYCTPLSEMGGRIVDRAFKWGIGPYLDGIFTQGNFGIVTQMTIALAPRPERIEGFFFGISKDCDLEMTAACVRHVLRQVGSVSGPINLMNQRRVLSMMEPYPFGQTGPNGIIPEAILKKMAKRNKVMEWMGAGALYGNKKLVNAARSEIRRLLRPVAKRLLFFTQSRVERLYRLSAFVPGTTGHNAAKIFGTLRKTLSLLSGGPSEIALPLSYWKSGQMPTNGESLNPAKDGCGLLWYSPLVPMLAGRVQIYSEMVTRVCTQHGIEPLITLTSLSDRCFGSTVPILFDPKDSEDIARAQACYTGLFEEGKKEGFVPYRTSIAAMDHFTNKDYVFWRLAKDIKRAVDKENIIAPGRYSLQVDD